jgi:hypothetical protein
VRRHGRERCLRTTTRYFSADGRVHTLTRDNQCDGEIERT